jgi:hypothetical protein
MGVVRSLFEPLRPAEMSGHDARLNGPATPAWALLDAPLGDARGAPRELVSRSCTRCG